MNILFTICGRAGSKGVENKNLRYINQIPLLYYTLSAIKLYQEKHPADQIDTAVNTDSEALKRLAVNQSAVPNIRGIPRRNELAGDTAAKVDVIRETYLLCSGCNLYDMVIDLDLTSPMRRVEDIEAAVKLLVADKEADLVFSAVPARRNPYFNMVERNKDFYRKVCPSEFTARQQAPAVYELNASIYAYRPRFLEQPVTRTILDYNCRMIEMPDYRVLDIDSEGDLELMAYLMEYFVKKDAGIRRMAETAAKI